MMRTDSAKSVTHVSDVNRHPCPGLNMAWLAVAESGWWSGLVGWRIGERRVLGAGVGREVQREGRTRFTLARER